MTKEKPQRGVKSRGRIPNFKTIAQEAQFWESHRLTDFADDGDEVSDVTFVERQPKKGMTLRLEPDTQAVLTQIARAKGIGPSTLARMWIIERLRQTAPPRSSRGRR